MHLIKRSLVEHSSTLTFWPFCGLFLNPHTAAFVKVKAVYMIFSKDFLK